MIGFIVAKFYFNLQIITEKAHIEVICLVRVCEMSLAHHLLEEEVY